MLRLIFASILILPTLGLANWQPNCASSSVFCTNEFVDIADSSNSIEQVIGNIPGFVRRNMTLKRGNNMDKIRVGILGPHGHMVTPRDSVSSSPDKPRAFVWDESSGFTASWNSGDPVHSAHDRIDLYDFDFERKEHRLFAWFPQKKNGKNFHNAHFVDSGGRTCTKCHGEVQRPIFPMYPDWPQFYGEFNDEMTGYPSGAQALRADLREMGNDFQPRERRLYEMFLGREAQTNPRYTPLYESDAMPPSRNPVYPYRPATTTSPFSNVSRAFYHRPNLRLGLLYNRLTALQTFEKIKASPIFQKFPDIVFFSLLDCNWDIVEGKGQNARQEILGPFLEEIQKISGLGGVNLRGAAFSPSELSNAQKAAAYSGTLNGAPVYYMYPDFTESGYTQIPYEDLLKILNLDIRDLDIRFRHDSSLRVSQGYNVFDPKAYSFTDSAMDIGYINDRYAMNPICDNRNQPCDFSYDQTYMDDMRYFNSYFDGSATTNELLAAQMLTYLTDRNQNFSGDLEDVRSTLRQLIPNPDLYFETLMKKYSRFTARLRLDRPFFEKMDGMSPWIQLPYSPDLLNVHNRESYWRNGRDCTRDVCLRHAMWTTRANRRNNIQNRNGGNNICWNTYTSMHRRYRK